MIAVLDSIEHADLRPPRLVHIHSPGPACNEIQLNDGTPLGACQLPDQIRSRLDLPANPHALSDHDRQD